MKKKPIEIKEIVIDDKKKDEKPVNKILEHFRAYTAADYKIDPHKMIHVAMWHYYNGFISSASLIADKQYRGKETILQEHIKEFQDEVMKGQDELKLLDQQRKGLIAK